MSCNNNIIYLMIQNNLSITHSSFLLCKCWQFTSFRKYSFNAFYLCQLPCLSNTPKKSGLSKVCLISLQCSSVKRKRGVSDLVIYSSNKMKTLGSNGPPSGDGGLWKGSGEVIGGWLSKNCNKREGVVGKLVV